MSNNKDKTAVNKDIVVKANSSAIDVFPTATLREALDHLGQCKASETKSAKERENYSLDITRIAEQYFTEFTSISKDHSLLMDDWRDNMALTLEVKAAEHSNLVTILPAEGDKPAKAKWNGTANNAISIAKGVVDFGIKVDECKSDSGEVSYRQVKRGVEAARAERRAQKNPDEAALNLAKEKCREAFKVLAAILFSTGDQELIEQLTNNLQEMASVSQAQIDEALELEAATAPDVVVEETADVVVEEKKAA